MPELTPALLPRGAWEASGFAGDTDSRTSSIVTSSFPESTKAEAGVSLVKETSVTFLLFLYLC